MRVWNNTDPRLLNRKHLLAEHREVHALLNDDHNWGSNPEYRRFKDLGGRGRSLLCLRHELLRVAMILRWGLTKHSRDQHETPVNSAAMSSRASTALVLYERHALPIPHPTNAYVIQHFFRSLMAPMNWPRCRLEGGATTPWGRDGILASTYIRAGDSWERAEFHHKRDTTKGH